MSDKSVPVAGRSVAGAGELELDPPVLLAGEDIEKYQRLSGQVTAALEPVDVIEVFWVRDVVDLLWEALRLRRLKASLLAASAKAGLNKVLSPLVPLHGAG